MIRRIFVLRRPARHEREAGVAMLIAVMVIMVIAVICTSVAVLASRSTRAAGDAQTAGVEKDLANAGLAEGVTYLRQVGVTPAIDAQAPVPSGASTACQPPTVNTTTPEWTRSKAALIDSGSQGTYAVWIEKVAAATSGNPAVFRVCAQGTSGQGKRTASVMAQYNPAGGAGGPYAVYGGDGVNLQSAAQVITNMSLYSEDCIDRKANKQTITGTDLATGRPAGAHSMLWVLDGGSCATSGSVHAAGKKVITPDYVNDDFPYDTDQAGGPVAGDPDASGKPALLAAPWSGSTLEPAGQTVDQFRAKWGIPDMLGATSINALQQTATQQGNYYYVTTSGLPSINTIDENNAVLFLDYKNHASVNLKGLNLGSFSQSTPCPTGKSLILVLRNADATANGNGTLRATLVIKNGGVTKMNGNFTLIGGLFADNGLDLSGNGTVMLDDCAIQNPPPGGTPQVDVSNYIEYDRN
jgi:Tfp pilus assembly protein PilX